MEDEMAALKSLTFTTIPTPAGNPTLDRRAKVIARLEEQKLLLKDTIIPLGPSLDKLPSVIDTLITAIRAGELDAQLAQSSKQPTPKNKAA
jgi:hypothetical protein